MCDLRNAIKTVFENCIFDSHLQKLSVSVFHAFLRAAVMQLNLVTAAMFQDNLLYVGRQNPCVTDCWKTPSHTAIFGWDTPDADTHSHMHCLQFTVTIS